MSDIKTKQQRSINMSHIRGKDTAPEIWVRKLLFAERYRYRKNVRDLPGSPDIYLPKYRTVIFVNGCFWHRHENCRYAYTPKSRTEFWKRKFQRNVERDREVQEQLAEQGIKILIIWECSIREAKRADEKKRKLLEEVQNFIHGNCQTGQI